MIETLTSKVLKWIPWKIQSVLSWTPRAVDIPQVDVLVPEHCDRTCNDADGQEGVGVLERIEVRDDDGDGDDRHPGHSVAGCCGQTPDPRCARSDVQQKKTKTAGGETSGR